MSIAITDDHRALADVAADFLVRHDGAAAKRAALLEAEHESPPEFWADAVRARLARACTSPSSTVAPGSALPELVVVVEQLGRAIAPGPFVPTVIASAVIAAAAPTERQAAALLPGAGRRFDDRSGRPRR